MKNLDDSLTEIDWLNTLRIKSAKEFKDGIGTCVNNDWSNETYSRKKYSEYSKPSYSYAYLIKLAIESSKSNKMKLSEIYEWIMDKYPYYKYMKTDNGKGWKNAIRHNLSLNKVFKRCPKNRTEPGKGSYWTIDSNCEENQIHDPPIKRLKLFNLITSKDVIQNVKNKEEISPANILSTENNVIKHSSNVDLDLNFDFDHNNSSNTSCTEFITTKRAFPINSPNFQEDHKIDIFINSFSDQSAFVPYSIHNNHICKISEISNSTCEISYKKNCDITTKRLPKMSLTNNPKSENNATEHSLPECETLTSSYVDLDHHNSTNTSISQFIYTKKDFPTNPLILLDKKSDIFANSFSDQSAFVPYTIQNNICKIAEISSSTCEISYPRNAKYSRSFLQTPKMTYSNYSSRNFSKGDGLLLPNLHEGLCDPFDLSELSSRAKPSTVLEIDSVGFGNGKNDIILKTPVLSQISGGSDFKDKTEESFTIKFPKMFNGFKDDGVEAIFENNNLHDSFLSIHRSFFDSETFDSRHVFSSAYTEKGPSYSQNLLLSTMSQYNINEVKNINQNLFEGSFGLSTSTTNILLNISGLKENWSSSSEGFELNDFNRDLDLSNDIQSGIIPSQDFLEMKNHLRCHRFKNDSITESYKPSSVSTTSTLKSTDTLHSKSPAWDKKADAINSKDVTVVIDQVSKSHLSEEDDIEDCFNWDSFL